MRLFRSRRIYEITGWLALWSAVLMGWAQAVTLSVESEYGADKVTPSVGINTTFPAGTEQTFDAPQYVYLNRNFEELDSIGDFNDPDESKIAYYRARNAGYAINSSETIQGAERFFKKTITEPTTVVWKWELDYAVFIEAATTGGAPIAGNAIGRPRPALGRHWVARDTQFSATVDRIVDGSAAGGEDQGFRYEAKAYTLENIRDRSSSTSAEKPNVDFGVEINDRIEASERSGRCLSERQAAISVGLSGSGGLRTSFSWVEGVVLP